MLRNVIKPTKFIMSFEQIILSCLNIIITRLNDEVYYVVRTSYLSCLNEIFMLFKQDK